MAQHWKQWCRLCACADPNISHINVFLKGEQAPPLADAIYKFFSVNITREDDYSRVICSGCHHLVNSIIYFAQRTSKVQAMFAELHNGSDEIDPEEVKLHYELHESNENEKDLKMFANSSAEQSFAANRVMCAEYSDAAENSDGVDFDPPEVKTELADENDSEMREEREDSLTSHEEVSDEETQDSDSDYIQTKKDKRKPFQRVEITSFKCLECCKVYKRFISYRRHMQDEHATTVDPPHFPCKECHKTFATAWQKQKHQSSHIVLEQEKNIPCPHCKKKKLSSDTDVQEHIRAVHEKLFICDECGGRYKTLSALKAHMVSHANERLLKCSWCDKSFKSKVSLKRHEDTHDATKYICPTCGIELNTQRTLQRHMVVHSDERRHKCDFCGNEYKRAKALKNHLILHTGLRPYKCNFCEKSFVNGSNCRSHKKRVHPVELAAMEAAGTKIVATNVPNLEYLRSVTINKAKSLDEKPISKRKAQIMHPIFGETMPAS